MTTVSSWSKTAGTVRETCSKCAAVQTTTPAPERAIMSCRTMPLWSGLRGTSTAQMRDSAHPRAARPHDLLNDSYTRCSDRVTERLQPATGVHSNLAADRRRPAGHEVRRPAACTKAQVLDVEQLGDREAVVYLDEIQLSRRVTNAGSLV